MILKMIISEAHDCYSGSVLPTEVTVILIKCLTVTIRIIQTTISILIMRLLVIILGKEDFLQENGPVQR